MLLLLVTNIALAGKLPSIDEPVRTGRTAPDDVAVVVGIEDYFVVPEVPYARRDAEAFYEHLVYARGVSSDNTSLLVDGANKETIEQSVRAALEKVGAGGTLWFYFSGHGGAANDGSRLLLGDDVRVDSYEARGVRVSDLKAMADSAGVRMAIVVDACYTGVGRDGTALAEGMRPFQPIKVVPRQRNQLEWSAASANQMAAPLKPVEHGAFTYFVVGALRGWADGEVDGRPDGAVDAMEARLFVERAMRKVEDLRQTPQMVIESSESWTLAEGALEEAPEELRPVVLEERKELNEPKSATPPRWVLGVQTGSIWLWSDDFDGEQSTAAIGESLSLRVRDRWQVGVQLHQAFVNGPRDLVEGDNRPAGDFALLRAGVRGEGRWAVGRLNLGAQLEVGGAYFSVPSSGTVQQALRETGIDGIEERISGAGPYASAGPQVGIPFQKNGVTLSLHVEAGVFALQQLGPYTSAALTLDTPL